MIFNVKKRFGLVKIFSIVLSIALIATTFSGCNAKAVIERGSDIQSVTVIREFISSRMLVKDTDNGKILINQVEDLKKLLDAYRLGLIKERD